MMVHVCPACMSRHWISHEPWLSECQNCRLYVSKLAPGPGKAFDGLKSLREKNFETTLDAIERIHPLRGRRLLEIGSAKGWFLAAAQKRGLIVNGVEPVTSDAEIARASGFDIEEGLFPEAPRNKGPYDIIAFNDVFEHLPDPTQAVRAIHEMLTSDGVLSINIPSSKGALFRTAKILNTVGISKPYDRMWQRGLPSPHMTYFSPENLKLLIERHSALRRWPDGNMSLPSIDLDGLRARLDSHDAGVPTWLALPVLTAFAPFSSLFPSDIHLGLFTKGKFVVR